ncbi:Protein zds1 [Trametes pubescens]|uniref:Protein zds1 n=1 Tax=Trametes pubescens TaxID=154538 RepID=A0A1M2VXZ9_TRAPU|nr:Protein zds1 [Trametes pubescens]
MQPSQLEIEREVEALRDIRRRSTAQGGPGSLILDPDLPSEAAQAQAAYWTPPDDSSSSSHDSHSEHSSVAAQDDPFHLFWVPARVHPELAPKEFKEFLKEHARADSTVPPPGRSNSVTSVGGLGRKKSMLSRQYDPNAHPGTQAGDEHVLPLRRNRTSIYANVPQLTIGDLQKLEELAEEASNSDDPSRLRSVLRRSLSLNISPSVIDQMDDLRDLGDDMDSPIVVPIGNQILKRTARTKIRKAGTGEGAHRFTTTRSRRKSLVGRAATLEPRSSSELSSSDHGDVDTIRRVGRSTDDIPEVPPLPRPESYSVETAIYDAYAQEETEHESVEGPPISRSPEIVTELVDDDTPVPREPELDGDAASAIPVLHHPQPQRALAPPTPDSPMPQRTPSPSTPDLTTSPSTSESVHQSRPSLPGGSTYHPPSPSPSERSEHHRREKEKKGLFGKWGGDKGGKKQKEKEKEQREREKEKESGFFGSLFGSKKKQEEPQTVSNSAAGRETAAALLGASKSSKGYIPPPSPQLGMYARYPIHVERAIYRLSHIKLANPRRPLYEQVLISNLMFWYLGVINKTQAQGQAPGQNGAATGAAEQQPSSPAMPSPAEKERADRERKEQEERERAEREREKAEKKESQKRGSLTKPAAGGARRAETPVRGPQYEMQHRAMEQGYGGYNQQPGGGGPPAPRTSSAPPPPMANAPRSPKQASQYSVQLVQPQPRPADSPGSANNQFYEIGEPSTLNAQQYPLIVTGAPQLPPGAMPPVAVEQTWIANTGSPALRNHSTSPPPRSGSPPTSPSSPGSRRPRSPPSANRYTPAQEKQPYSGVGAGGGARIAGRSLSATAAPSQPMAPMNGKVKKVMSAHAMPARQSSEDEDVPLAVYQQQQRRK